MAQELQYTSVAAGLKPGSRGFCAVVMTRGLSNHVAERLEALSGYDMYYKVGSPHVDNNPRLYAHWIVQLEGKPAHVLSFVTYSGMDFEGRANKFAHHIYLDDADLILGGPGWLIMHPAVMERWYMAPPRWIEARTMPKGDAVVCRPDLWIKASGDAGWAGALAQHLLDEPNKPAYIIFPITIDPLPLVGEAQAFLPAEARWNATFSTYFTRLAADMTCAWRFCLDGTDAAKEAREAAGRTLVIDLAGTRKLAPPSALVFTARNAPPRYSHASMRQHQNLPESEVESTIQIPESSAPPTEAVAPTKNLPPLAPLDTPLEMPPSAPPPAEIHTAPQATSAPPKPSLPPNTPPEVRNEISLPSPELPRSTPAKDAQPSGESKNSQRPRHYEPTSMLDLGNEENDAAELEDAMKRQKRAKLAKTRAAGERVARQKETEQSRESAGPDDVEFEDEPQTSQEKTDSSFDSSIGRVAEPDAGSVPAAPKLEAGPKKGSSRIAIWLLAAAIVAAVLIAAFLPQLKARFSRLNSTSSEAGGVAHSNTASPVDSKLPVSKLKLLPVPGQANFSAIALNLDVPTAASPVPAAYRLYTLKLTNCKINWLTQEETLQPALNLVRKDNGIEVAVPCETSIAKAGSISVGGVMIEKDALVWRWLYTGVWTEKMQQAWRAIAPTIAQSVVEVREPSGATIAKLQFVVPIERTLRPETTSAVFSDLKSAAPVLLTMSSLPPGWRSSDDIEPGQPLELTHVSGAKVSFHAELNQSIWTVVAVWPVDSRADRLTSAIAQQEAELNQLQALKTSPDAIAGTQGDVDRIKDELDRMTAQIEQAKARQPVDAAAIATLETRRRDLSESLTQFREKVEKMKSAPAAIDALRTQRKTASDRLLAVNELEHASLLIVSSTSRAVLAIVNLVNSTPPPDNAAAPSP